MPTLRQLLILLVCALVAWSLPEEGEKLFPAVFGPVAVQWTFMMLAVLLSSVGLFFVLQVCFLRPVDLRKAAGLFAGFLFILGMNLATYGSLFYSFSKVDEVLQSMAEPVAPEFTQKLATETDPVERGRIARGIFIFSGSAVAYQAADGGTVTYQPTADDEKKWSEHQKTDTQLRESKAFLETIRANSLRLFIINLAALTLSLAAGAVTIIYHKRASTLAIGAARG